MRSTTTSLALSLFVVVVVSPFGSDAFRPPAAATASHAHGQHHTQRKRSLSTKLNYIGLEGLNGFLEQSPYLAAFLTTSFKASAADMVAQHNQASKQQEQQQQQQQPHHLLEATETATAATSTTQSTFLQDVEAAAPPSFDIMRNLAFLCYGGFWQGMFQQYLYTTIYPAMFGDHTGVVADMSTFLTTVLPQVAFDTIIMGPCICLPICYSVKSLFAGSSSSSRGDTSSRASEFDLVDLLSHAVRTGLAKYQDDVTQRGLLQLFWSIWVPAQCLTFGVIPTQWRVVFVALVSFFWVCALSTISSSSTSLDASATNTSKAQELEKQKQQQQQQQQQQEKKFEAMFGLEEKREMTLIQYEVSRG